MTAWELDALIRAQGAWDDARLSGWPDDDCREYALEVFEAAKKAEILRRAGVA